MKIKLGQPTGFWNIGKRETQQDSLYPLPENLSKEDRFFIVCDGMGGHSGGEIASSTIVKGLSSYYDAFMKPQASKENFLNLLERAQLDLDELYNEEQGNHQMGTTLTFLCFHANGYLAAHIGDSRIYHFRPGRITQLPYRSKDHTQTQDLMDEGMLSPIASLTYGGRNILDRAIMPQSRYKATVWESEDLQAGDYFMLCSDGVLEWLTDEMLQFIFMPYRTIDEIKELLLKHCEMSSDNNTCLIIPVEEVEMEEKSSLQEPVTSLGFSTAVGSQECDMPEEDKEIEETEKLESPCLDSAEEPKHETEPVDELLMQSTSNYQPDETFQKNIEKMYQNYVEEATQPKSEEEKPSATLASTPYWFEEKE